MFDAISPRYDLLNHLLSLNIDLLWRRRAAEACANPARALDVCCGTGDMAIQLRRRWNRSVVGADFAHRMLALARRKDPSIPWLQGDTTSLPFPNDSFDAVTVAFGIRNVTDPLAAIREMARVTRPGGRVVILEFTLPPNRLLRPLYLLYFTRILPLIGTLVSRTRTNAYSYLPDSVRNWHPPHDLARIMEGGGLVGVRWEWLTLGIAAIHAGVKPNPLRPKG
jgi:demethylmenaquinone methyltransferase/2-methoxy-6-polyprenyl-1,4-benzoquinol methylase